MMKLCTSYNFSGTLQQVFYDELKKFVEVIKICPWANA